MIEAQFWNSVTTSDLMALSGIVAFFAGGAALIVSTFPTHSEALAQHVKLVFPASGAKTKSKAAGGVRPLASLQKLPSLGGGLSEAEHRQVIRLLWTFGVSADRAVTYFLAIRLILSVALGASAAVFAGRYFVAAAAHWQLQLMAAAVGAVPGWLIPILFVSHKLKKRAKAIGSGLPNALELLVVCVEAGLSLEEGLQRVAHELRESQPAIAEELAITWAEVNILPDRVQALVNLANRTDNPSVRSVVSMLSQSLRFGTPLAQSLRVGANEMRSDQITRLEERAAKLPALMTIPVMLFIMPTIFLIIGGPSALRLMDMFRH